MTEVTECRCRCKDEVERDLEIFFQKRFPMTHNPNSSGKPEASEENHNHDQPT